MIHVETCIGYTDGRHDRRSSELAYSRTYASHTRGSNEADSAFFVTASCGYISDRYTVPIVGVCHARGDTGASSALHGRNERTASVKATSDYFRLSHLNTTQVDVLIKD